MNRISELRSKLGLTQKQLAEFLGIAQNTLSQYENERRKVDTKTLILMAKKFGVSANYVLGLPEKTEISGSQLAPVNISGVTRIAILCEQDQVNAYLDLGWKLLHIGQDAVSQDGAMQAHIVYTLGWFGDARKAPTLDFEGILNRNIDYM